ncbi:MAG: transporter [Acidiferrobacteraceae bacterium]|jgi:drug/metabolite transporter (DMT)-like permease|nr:transporter [Acidiferrobacteraceae bacterium]|tara:strand:+ start:2382 stop:3296 length:915 start_codon:yes stop_codon:yes gene_type:complete
MPVLIIKQEGHSKHWILLIVLGIAWGGSFSIAKIALENGYHPLGINWWVSAISTVLLMFYILVRQKKLPIDRNHIYIYVVCGALGTAIPGVLYFFSLKHISPGIVAIMMANVPIMTFVVATIRGIEKKSFFRVLGVLLGVASILLLIVPEESLPERSAIPWVIVMAFAAACYAAENIVLARRVPPTADTYVVLFGMSVASTLMMTPFLLLSDAFVPISTPLQRSDLAIVGLSALNVLCYGSFVLLVLRAGPVFASQTAYIITISGVLWGILIFNDQHSVWVWVSLIVMLIALSLVTPKISNLSN